MSVVEQSEDGVEASTSGMMETTMMEGEEYYNPDDTGTWAQKEMSDQLCRICAKPNQYLIPIFEGEGIEHQLEPKIQKHLPIEVSESDDLPLQVCYQCASTLIAWNDLVIACIEADKKLRQMHEQEEEDEDDKGAEFFDEPIHDSDEGEDPVEPSTSIATVTSDTQSDATSHPKRSPGKAKKPKLKMTLVKSPTAGPSGLKSPLKRVASKAKGDAGQEATERAHGPGLCKPCQTQPTYDSSTLIQKRYSIWVLKKQSQVYLCDVFETNNQILVFERPGDNIASHCSDMSKVTADSASDKCLDSVVRGVRKGTFKGYSLKIASKLSENNFASSTSVAEDGIADKLCEDVVLEAAGDSSAVCCRNVTIGVDASDVTGYSPSNVASQVIVGSVEGNRGVLFEVVGDGLEPYSPDRVFDLPEDSVVSNCPDSLLFDVVGTGFEGYSPDTVFDLAEDCISGYCPDKEVVLEVVGSSFEGYSHDAGFDLAENSVAGYYPDNMVSELAENGATGNFPNYIVSELRKENIAERYRDYRSKVSELPKGNVAVLTDGSKCHDNTVPEISDGDQCPDNIVLKLSALSDVGHCPDYGVSELLKDNAVDIYNHYRPIESKLPEEGVVGQCPNNTVPELPEDSIVGQCPDNTVPEDSVVGQCLDKTVSGLPEISECDQSPGTRLSKLYEISDAGHYRYIVSELLKDNVADNFTEYGQIVSELPPDSVEGQCPNNAASKMHEFSDKGPDSMMPELLEVGVAGQCLNHTVSALPDNNVSGQCPNELLDDNVAGQCANRTVSDLLEDSVADQCPNKTLSELRKDKVGGQCTDMLLELPEDNVAGQCAHNMLSELPKDNFAGQCTDMLSEFPKDNVVGQDVHNMLSELPKDNVAAESLHNTVSELIEDNVENQCHDNIVSELPKDNVAGHCADSTVSELLEGNVVVKCTNITVLEQPAIGDVDVSPKAAVSGLTEIRLPGNTVLKLIEIVDAGQCVDSAVTENLVTVQCSDITVSELSGNFVTGPCLGNTVPELPENYVAGQCLVNSVSEEADINDVDRNERPGNAMPDLPEISIVRHCPNYVPSKSERPEKSVTDQCPDNTVFELAEISDAGQCRNRVSEPDKVSLEAQCTSNIVSELGGFCAATQCANNKLSALGEDTSNVYDTSLPPSVNAIFNSPTLASVEQNNGTEIFLQSSSPQIGSATVKYLRELWSKKSFNSFFYKYRRNSRGIYKLKRMPSSQLLHCPFCRKHFRGIFMLQVHCRFHSGITPFYCKFCGKRYRLCTSLKVHLTHCKGNESKRVLKHPLKKGDGECYECTLCGKKYKSKAGLKEHVRSHVGKARKKLKCQVCGCKFSRKGELFTHALSHKEQDLYACDVCQKVYLNKRDLVEHQICHSTKRPFGCSDCGASYKRKSHLTRHQTSHTNNLCRVEEPRIEASGQHPYKCSHCSKVWSTARLLEMHEITHVDRRMHVCNICDKRFVQMGALKRHTNTVHGGIKRFECETCSMRFTTKVTRDNHMLIHSGQKPFSCEVCGKAFRTRQQLKLHKAIHSEVRPFGCSLCGRTFRRRPHLVIHLRTHTGEKPYACPVCTRAYAQKNDMKKHLRAQHARV